MPRNPPTPDQPEELPATSGLGAGIRLRGGGDAETLAEPGVWLFPASRWALPAFLVVTVISAIGVVALLVTPWLRPVHLAADRVDAVFEPGLQAGGRIWTEPGELEPDRFTSRFCDGLLSRTLSLAERSLMVTGRGEEPGNALAAVYPTAEEAEQAYAVLGGGLGQCRTRGARWVPSEGREAVSGVTAFRLETQRAVRGNRHHMVLVHYANTVTLFMTPTAPDAAATREAYAARVAAVSRAA